MNTTKNQDRAISNFDKWVTGDGDLWHQDFAQKFTTCLLFFFTDADPDILETLGHEMADICYGFSGDSMLDLVDFINKHPLPKKISYVMAYAEKAKHHHRPKLDEAISKKLTRLRNLAEGEAKVFKIADQQVLIDLSTSLSTRFEEEV